MNSSSKILSSGEITHQHELEQHLLKHTISSGLSPLPNSAPTTTLIHQHNFSNIHHMQSLPNQQSSVIFNSTHSTPFSVTDILSPIEDSYRKLELNCSPPSPFRTNSSESSITSPNTLGSSTMANPYAMGSLYHSPGVQSYCGPADNLSLAGHYSDMRSSASWYGSTTNDPRFAITRLMGGSATTSMGHMANMGSLATCNVTDSKPLQFPLTQRRKRRVLFTQAQVKIWFQNHRYKCKRQAKEKAMAEQSQQNQTSSSPRRVAVPVLVKDGKPCSGNSSTPLSQQAGTASNTSNTSNNNTNINENISTTEVNNSITGGLNLITGETTNSHSPDTSNSLIASYNGTIGSHNQIQQQSCNNSIMSNSLAMAYRNQNNFISNGHQQQCTGYLPLQGRAW
ncbi:homeobox protein Nkx-2.4 isoform X2 [Bactrocera dorsalis]|uniref:Homeobox protein Nkx-2.4 isoform X2 n=1 Tax=Bactrocera dorsalis TaxID=27457 RepID=A0ABM3J9Z7_BACDO|nr:homeobox protein Nkx-2.4 isoform X2 [Bactrocera dorsalis]